MHSKHYIKHPVAITGAVLENNGWFYILLPGVR